MKLSDALEILAYCLYDGKVDQKSEFETELYNDLLSKVKEELFHEFGFCINSIIKSYTMTSLIIVYDSTIKSRLNQDERCRISSLQWLGFT